MSDQTKKLVPKLRFSEFRNTSEWNYLNGDKVFVPISNKKHNSDLPILAITQDQGAVPRDLINYKVIATEQSIESYKVVEVGDFIISLRSFQGGIEYSDYKGICSPAYIILRKNIKVVDLFFKFYFKTDLFIKDLNKNIEGIRDGKMVSYAQFSDILLPVPKYEEQQKIANCLSSIDELITAQTKKINALKDYKKGLMQQLFPAEGKTVPKLRFPEFENVGVWRPIKFGEVATFINGKAYKQEELLDSGKYPVLRVGNFFTSNHWYYSNLELDKDKYCESGDLLYAWSASFGPRIWSGDKSIYHYHIWKVVPNNGISLKFLYILLDSETERMKSNSSNGLGLLHITKGTIEGWNSYIPSLPEQEKISNFILSIDDLISLQNQKLSKLKDHKKGLIQQLFPLLLDEVAND